MVQWDRNGDTKCNTCGRHGYGDKNRHRAIQRLRAAGWHHSSGQTYGGRDYEEILCPSCAKDERRKKRDRPRMEQDTLPMMQEELWQTAPKSQRGNDVT